MIRPILGECDRGPLGRPSGPERRLPDHQPRRAALVLLAAAALTVVGIRFNAAVTAALLAHPASAVPGSIPALVREPQRSSSQPPPRGISDNPVDTTRCLTQLNQSTERILMVCLIARRKQIDSLLAKPDRAVWHLPAVAAMATT